MSVTDVWDTWTLQVSEDHLLLPASLSPRLSSWELLPSESPVLLREPCWPWRACVPSLLDASSAALDLFSFSLFSLLHVLQWAPFTSASASLHSLFYMFYNVTFLTFGVKHFHDIFYYKFEKVCLNICREFSITQPQHMICSYFLLLLWLPGSYLHLTEGSVNSCQKFFTFL